MLQSFINKQCVYSTLRFGGVCVEVINVNRQMSSMNAFCAKANDPQFLPQTLVLCKKPPKCWENLETKLRSLSAEASRAYVLQLAGKDLDTHALDAQHQSRAHLQTARDHRVWWVMHSHLALATTRVIFNSSLLAQVTYTATSRIYCWSFTKSVHVHNPPCIALNDQ